MSERKAFLKAIIDAPADDRPRLVYADWLDETARMVPCPSNRAAVADPEHRYCSICSGSGEVSNGDRERAEFIRVQCELESRFPNHGHIPPMRNCRGCELRDRVDCLLSGHGFKFIDSLPGMHYYWSRSPNHYGWFAGNGESQVKIGAIFRRGFVSEIRCTLAQFVGGVCVTCNGSTRDPKDNVPYPGDDVPFPSGGWVRQSCTDCHGTGCAPGCAAVVFREHPVERVVLTDREPFAERGREPTWFAWFAEPMALNPEAVILPNIYSLLRKQKPWRWDRAGGGAIHYPTREAALDAISTACVSYGRSLI